MFNSTSALESFARYDSVDANQAPKAQSCSARLCKVVSQICSLFSSLFSCFSSRREIKTESSPLVVERIAPKSVPTVIKPTESSRLVVERIAPPPPVTTVINPPESSRLVVERPTPPQSVTTVIKPTEPSPQVVERTTPIVETKQKEQQIPTQSPEDFARSMKKHREYYERLQTSFDSPYAYKFALRIYD